MNACSYKVDLNFSHFKRMYKNINRLNLHVSRVTRVSPGAAAGGHARARRHGGPHGGHQVGSALRQVR